MKVDRLNVISDCEPIVLKGDITAVPLRKRRSSYQITAV